MPKSIAPYRLLECGYKHGLVANATDWTSRR